MKKSSFTIYNASAGSGKTYTLAKEYIKIILQSATNDAYKNILAITFTNKAVEEMKSRILFYLLEFSKEETSEKAFHVLTEIHQETSLSIATIKDKSKSIVKNIIHNYTAFDISTIDKFTLKVIKSFVHELNIPLDFDVSLDTNLLLQEAIDTIISKAGEDEELTKLLLDFSKNNTNDDKNWDITRELLAASALLTNENNKPEVNKLKDKSIEDFVDTRKFIVKEIDNKKEEIKILVENIFKELMVNEITLESFSSQYFPNHLKKCLSHTVLNKDLFKYMTIEDVAVNKNAVNKEKIIQLLPSILDKLYKIYELYQKVIFFEAFKKNIYPLSLLNTINQEFKKIQNEQNILSISEFNEIINNEIQNQPAPFIYEKIGDKYKHFFIDEFQDTSILQWKNLFPLLDNSLASEENGVKGSLLLVGDPKQAIYRWRGGKAEQFIELSNLESPFSNKEKRTLNLETNYRSYSEVIQFNNEFFSFLASKLNNVDYIDLYKNKSFQKLNSKKGGFVDISFVEENGNDFSEEEENKEAKFLAKTLETIQSCMSNGFNYKDMAILTRKKDKGILLANFLTENKIPIISSETLLIQNATEVKLIINVLKYLNNKNDNDAKFQILYYVAHNLQNTHNVHQIISTNLHTNESALEFFLGQIGVEINFNFCRKKSLYETVEIIVGAFIKQNANNSYVQYFLDLVLERQTKVQSSITEFLEYWNRLGFQKSIPSPEGNNAIKILTIHKSKGLEFPVIIYPFANESLSKSQKDQLWIPLENDNIKIDNALINNNNDIPIYSDTAKKIYEEKKQEEILDAINVLYVALTRAEEQIHIISELKINKDGKLPNMISSYFIEFLQLKNLFSNDKSKYGFGDSRKTLPQETLKETSELIQIVETKIKPEAIKIAQKEAIMWGTIQKEAIEFGNTIHEILSFIKCKNDVSIALVKALEKGLIKLSQINEIELFILKIINHEELTIFFNNQFDIYNEQQIIDAFNSTLIPDKIAIHNNKAYLLDYKTGLPNNKHKSQIESYQKVLEKMNYEVVEKVLVYLSDDIKVIHL